MIPLPLQHIVPDHYVVVGPGGNRLGVVGDLEELARILKSDAGADTESRWVKRGKAKTLVGILVLTDEDAWMCRNRKFSMRDFMPDSYTHIVRFQSGARCYELDRIHLVAPETETSGEAAGAIGAKGGVGGGIRSGRRLGLVGTKKPGPKPGVLGVTGFKRSARF